MYIAALACCLEETLEWSLDRQVQASTEGQCHHRVQVCFFTPNKREAQSTAPWRKGYLLCITDCCYCPCGKGEHLCILEPQPQPRRSRCHFGLHTQAISCQPHQLTTTRLSSEQVPGSRECAALKYTNIMRTITQPSRPSAYAAANSGRKVISSESPRTHVAPKTTACGRSSFLIQQASRCHLSAYCKLP